MKRETEYRVCRLTEEGNQMFSFQFDETQNMDDVRCVSNLKTGEIILAVKIPKEKADQMLKVNPQIIKSQKYIWKLWHDGYDWCISKEGDREDI